MRYQTRPLTLNPDQLVGLSNRLNAIRGQLAGLDWNTAATFIINGLKREELIAANSAFLHELYFDNLGGNGVLPSCGLTLRARGMDARYIVGGIEAWQAAGLPLQGQGGTA